MWNKTYTRRAKMHSLGMGDIGFHQLQLMSNKIDDYHDYHDNHDNRTALES